MINVAKYDTCCCRDVRSLKSIASFKLLVQK